MNKILIIAGEASGDRHAADLVREISRIRPETEFTGIGGDEMKVAGVELLYHISKMAVLGITEILRHLPFFRKVKQRVKFELRNGIDAVILVDYPGFNLRIAKIAHGLNIPVIYYISPQLWAWGEKRVEKIRKYVDLMLVLFRFEADFYKTHGINAQFVGHPLVDQIKIAQSEADFQRENNLPSGKPIVGLFPGSREMEVRNLLPLMIDVAQRLKKQFDCLPIIGRSTHLPEKLYHEICGSEDVPILSGVSPHLMRFSYAAMVASGTATLECGFLQTPMVVLYAVSPITYWLGKMLVKIDKIALVNIVAGEEIVPEFVQKDMTASAVCKAMARYFDDGEYYRSVKKRLAKINAALGEGGASRRAAEQIDHFLRGKRQ